jgi:hypothetical protein
MVGKAQPEQWKSTGNQTYKLSTSRKCHQLQTEIATGAKSIWLVKYEL